MQINGAAQSAGSSIAIFAHEMREPLASILLAAQAAGEGGSDDHTNLELWSVVERQGRYLAGIIERVLELGRGSRGTPALSKEWFDLGEMIMNAAQTVKSLVTSRSHRLTLSLPPAPAYIFADPLRMQQVVVNLLANAAKYTGRGGRINVCMRLLDSLAVIEVRDNGVGISPELLPHVFDLFRQGTEARSDKFSGLGIGLALVKSLVEMHGGSVSAHSSGTDAGATFVVSLPQAESEVCRPHADVPNAPGEPCTENAWADSAMLDA